MSTTSVNLKVGTQKVNNDLILLDKIIEKTAEKKIEWTRITDGYKAYVGEGPLALVPIMAKRQLLGPTWSSFSVYRGNEELLNLETNTNDIFSISGLAKQRGLCKG